MAVSLESAVKLAVERAPLLGEEVVPLQKAAGRILTQNICAAVVQPPFDRSPLDGYAVIAADTCGADADRPVHLKVVDKVYAGAVSAVPVLPGQAVRLMTGSMMPAGADAVIRQEHTDEGEETVRLFQSVPSGGNYCRRGEEYGVGDLLLSAGQQIDAAAAAVAAGAGMARLPVRRRVRAAVICTGDEVCPPGRPLPPGKIYDANTSYLAARLHQLGAEVTFVGAAGDDLEQMISVLHGCESEADLILTTGGVSVGEKDLVEAAMVAHKAEVVFHGIDIKPGMPTLFAAKGEKLFLGLSGNPFAAAVPFELLIHPLIARMTGNASLEMRRGRARAANSLHKRGPTRRFLRAHCRNGVVSIPAEQSNGQMRSMIGCNCLVELPSGRGQIERGEMVDIIWL